MHQLALFSGWDWPLSTLCAGTVVSRMGDSGCHDLMLGGRLGVWLTPEMICISTVSYVIRGFHETRYDFFVTSSARAGVLSRIPCLHRGCAWPLRPCLRYCRTRVIPRGGIDAEHP